MSKKNLLILSLFLALFQITASAQASNPRRFNERFVAASVRTIFSAQMTYQSTVGAGAFATLSELRQAEVIDAVLASGEKYGYVFALSRTHASATTPPRFSLTATPRRYPRTGRRSFYIDETGEMRAADKNGAAADASDPVISECDALGIYNNERCAVMDLRKVASAQLSYYATAGGGGSYGTLAELRAAGLIPARLATGASHGYAFSVQLIPPADGAPASFRLRATPVEYDVSGVRSFYIDTALVMRGADRQGQPADETDPPIEN